VKQGGTTRGQNYGAVIDIILPGKASFTCYPPTPISMRVRIEEVEESLLGTHPSL
jgi:hypothetical protein